MTTQDYIDNLLPTPFTTVASIHRQINALAGPHHTPGPWGIPGPSPDMIGTEGPDRRLVAQVHGQNFEANARLIAAAPELLAACQAVMSAARSCIEHPLVERPRWGEVHLLLVSAIAKATGGPTP